MKEIIGTSYIQGGLYGCGKGYIDIKLGYSVYQWGSRADRLAPTSPRNITETFDKNLVHDNTDHAVL